MTITASAPAQTVNGTTTADLPREVAGKPTITVYGPETCPNCKKVLDFFARKGIAASKITMESGDANHRYITQTLGYQEAPVVVLDTVDAGSKQPVNVHWSGARQDMLMGVAALVQRSRN